MSEIQTTKKIHFIGILANVNESILKLNGILEHGFEIKQISTNDCVNWCSINFSTSIINSHELFLHNCMDEKVKTYYFHNSFEGEVTFNPESRIVTKHPDNFNGWDKFYNDYLDNLTGLMRLFKEGNIRKPFKFYFFTENDIPITIGTWSSPRALTNIYSLKDSEIQELKNFLKDFDLDFKEKSLKLAFENYDLSYEVDNLNLQFLTLMNALEVILKPESAQTDLVYRLSRNAAVLLGKDKEDSYRIYKELNGLYAIRSSIVHVGEPKEKKGKKRKLITNEEMIEKLARLKGYVRNSIKEMSFIFKKDGKNKDDIFKMLNECGFGERPWRKD